VIVFVTLSARRFMALDVPAAATSWHSDGNPRTSQGFACANATIIGGPASWPDTLKAATDFAKETGQIIPLAEWEKRVASVDAEIAEAMAELKAKRGKT